MQRTFAASLGVPIEYLKLSYSDLTEVARQYIVREYVKADVYYQSLNVKIVEEEAVYTVIWYWYYLDL